MRKNKFGVSSKPRRTYNGKTYMSKLECDYRKYLDILTKAIGSTNEVVNVVEQVPFPVVVNGVKICVYRLDFAVTYACGRTEFVDTKGMATPMYKIKKKLVEAVHGITIKEVKAGDFKIR